MRIQKRFTRGLTFFIFFAAVLLMTQIPIHASQIIVHANTHPPVVSKGQPTEIIVRALTPQGNPIPQAHVKISAGGGFFIHSNSTTVEGQTDGNGMFATPWKCVQCAPAYVFDIEVTKPGFQKGTAPAQVNITSQPMPGPGGHITVHANTHPPMVSKGQPTEIIVRALTPQGDPIPQAHVKISAGGGSFIHSNATTVDGQTDSNGRFATPWECMQCAPTYVFDIEVTKPEFQTVTTQTQVDITSQPMPGPGGQMTVRANTHPETISRGQPTEILVKVLTPQGDPIPQAHVKISAGGGLFRHSNTTTIEGETNAQGDFSTPWKCNQCAPAYVFSIEVTKPGFEKTTSQAQVNITTN